MPGMSPRIKAKKGRFGDLGLAEVVRIISPVTGTTQSSGVAFTATGKATDDLTGDVSANIVWTSDLDAGIGADGGSTSLTLTTVGTHVITASAAHGSPAVDGTATIVVNVV